MPKATEKDRLPYESGDLVGRRVNELECHNACGKWSNRFAWILFLAWLCVIVNWLWSVPYVGVTERLYGVPGTTWVTR